MTDVLASGTCGCGRKWAMTSTEYVSYAGLDGVPKRNADTIDTVGDGHQSWSCPFCGRDETTRPSVVAVTDPVLVDPPGRVHVLALCETLFINLKPDVLYRLEVVPGCGRCESLAAGEAADLSIVHRHVEKEHERLRALKS
jgi:hypothetical protein